MYIKAGLGTLKTYTSAHNYGFGSTSKATNILYHEILPGIEGALPTTTKVSKCLDNTSMIISRGCTTVCVCVCVCAKAENMAHPHRGLTNRCG